MGKLGVSKLLIVSPHRSNHEASHRGLTRILIPNWLEAGVKDLDGKIESSAYGETPFSVIDRVCELLVLSSEDRLLDLGAGAASFIAPLLKKGHDAVGLERNPALIEVGQKFLDSLRLDVEALQLADFLVAPWPLANKAFSASARFDKSTLKLLAERLDQTEQIEKIAFLGRVPVMSSNWHLTHSESINLIWNAGEGNLEEALEVWSRRAL